MAVSDLNSFLPGICTLKLWSLSIAHQTMWSCRIMCRKWICHFHPFSAFDTAISSFTRMYHILAGLWKGTYTAWILSTKGGQKEDTKKIQCTLLYGEKKQIHLKNTVPYRAIFRYTALSIFSSCLRQEASRALGPCPGAWSNGSLISLLFVDWPMNT